MNPPHTILTGSRGRLRPGSGVAEATRSAIARSMDHPPVKDRATVPMVDTTIIPDRNAGIGSLLWDLRNPRDPSRDGTPLLSRDFAFIDVGVSHARAAIALQTLLLRDLGMEVEYVATERPEALPFAHVTPLGSGADAILSSLTRMISSKGSARAVEELHFTVDHRGKVTSIAYRYDLHGNEIREAYFMGRPFLYAGEMIGYSCPELDGLMAPVVTEIEARMDRDRAPNTACWDDFMVRRHPLETDLADFGIPLQKTNVPRRITGKQNVLFLGNVLNHYPQDEQSHELERVTANLEHGDLVIVQSDEVATPSIEVLQILGEGTRRRRQRLRWINTRDLEVRMPDCGPEGWRSIALKPEVTRAAGQVMQSLAERAGFTGWPDEARPMLVHRYIGHVFATYFRAMPVAETLRVATREALRRLPPMECLTGIAPPANEIDHSIEPLHR